MRSKAQKNARIIIRVMIVFVLVGLFLGVHFGDTKVYATEMLDGGTNKDSSAPLLSNQTTNINTYDGAVGRPTYFRFIPNSNGNYTIKSDGYINTEGELYDSNGVSIAENDDVIPGIDENFYINTFLNAWYTYYIRVTNYISSNPDQTQLIISGDSGGSLDDGTPPIVNSVGVPLNGIYQAGSNLEFTLNFSKPVNVNIDGGTPYITVTIGSSTVHADYISGSGTSTLVFRYTVAADDSDTDGIAVNTMELNGGIIRDGASNDANLELNSVASTAGVTVDGVAPVVISVAAPANSTYKIGDSLSLVVSYSEAVNVITTGGTPYITLTIGSKTVQAPYLIGSGSSNLTFRYMIESGDQDSDGIEIGSMTLNGGTVKDDVGNDSNPILNYVDPATGVLVNGVAPKVNSVEVPSNSTYNVGNTLGFRVHFSEEVTVTGTPKIAIEVGSSTVYANYTSGTGSPDLVFRYTVNAGEQDSDGITVGAMSLNSGTIKNSIGNNADLTLNSIASTANVLVDGAAPTVASVSIPANGIYKSGTNLDFVVNFTEAVTVNSASGTPRVAITVGSTTFYANYTSGSGSTALVFRYTVAAGNQDSDGIIVGVMNLNGGTIKDGAGNDADISLNSVASTAFVNVDGVAPAVGSVSVPSNGTYKIGDNLDITVNFSEAVNVTTVGGTPRIALVVGSTTVYASYLSGSGTSTLGFRYTVTPGTLDSNGITIGAMSLNNGTLKDGAGNDALMTLTNVASAVGVLVNGVEPAVNSVVVPTNGTYTVGNTLEFIVKYSDAVTVTGTPRIAITIGSTTAYAEYVNGSGSSDLLFRYTVTTGEQDRNGITVGVLSLNGGTIKSSIGNDANLTLNSIASTANVFVDGAAPKVESVYVPASRTYMAGTNLNFTVNFSEAVTLVTTSDVPGIAITVGSTPVYAEYTSGSGSTALVFRYTVKPGDYDNDGITVGAMDLHGGSIKDGFGNEANVTLYSVTSTTSVKVDGIAPAVSSVAVPSNGTYRIGDYLDITVNFSKAVYMNVVGGTPYITCTIGSTTVNASYVSGAGTSSLVFRYMVVSGNQDSDGIAVGTVSLNGGTIKDEIGNSAVLTLSNVAATSGVLVNGVSPTVNSVVVPSNGTYKAGHNLDFTVHFSEAVTVTGIPRIAITVGSATVYADYVNGSGTSDLVYRYTVTTGAQDSNGITVGAMSLNGGTIKNSVSNEAILSLNSVASTANVNVDGIDPAIASVQVPNAGLYKVGDALEFIVNYAENIVVTGNTSVLKMNVGGIVRDVSYSTSSGSHITYRYIVQAGDNGSITLGTDVQLGTSTILDIAGNNALTNLNGVESTTGITMDTTAPGVVANIDLADDDTNAGIDGRDFTVSFAEPADESDVTAYRIYLYKDSEAPMNAAAMDLLATGSKVAVKTIVKTANNDGAAASLGSNVTTDSKGQTLNGGDYRIIVRAVDSVGNCSFAVTGTSGLIVKDVDHTPTGGNNPSTSDSITQTEGKIEKDQKRNENAPAASLNNSGEELKSKILSTEEQALVAKGKDAKVILKIEDIRNSVKEEDKKQIEEMLAAEKATKDDIAVLYIDISLFKRIGDGEETKITKTSGKISISIEVPETMWNSKDGINRSYQVIRVHDGVAELLTGTFDPITHLFTFETDRFSTYALTYQDVNVPSNQNEGNVTDQGTAYNDFYHLRLTAKATKNSQMLSFNKVSGADGYLIYGAQCGKQMKKLADVADSITSYTVTNLKQATYYKYQVKAYKVINGKKVILASSKTIHTVTTSKIYANPVKITSDFTSINLLKGETKPVICQVVLPQGMKLMEHTDVIRYETSNSKVVSISKGIVTAKSKGSCYVYAYAQNGAYVRIKVIVK